MHKLDKIFYRRNDVVKIARELLGKHLCTYINNRLTTSIIVETEAYRAPEDQASHAYNNRKTDRTKPFFHEGGIAYVYLIYGMYKLFNIVTNVSDIPHAVLIRAVEPQKGKETMKNRLNLKNMSKKYTAGPGLLTKALGIDISHNMVDLQQSTIWIEDHNHKINKSNIMQGPRVGMNIPEPWKSIPWRFYIKDNPWVSSPK